MLILEQGLVLFLEQGLVLFLEQGLMHCMTQREGAHLGGGKGQFHFPDPLIRILLNCITLIKYRRHPCSRSEEWHACMHVTSN